MPKTAAHTSVHPVTHNLASWSPEGRFDQEILQLPDPHLQKAKQARDHLNLLMQSFAEEASHMHANADESIQGEP